MTVLGTAYVNIEAITKKLKPQIESALAKIDDTFTIKVGADVSKAMKELSALEAIAQDMHVKVEADADVSKALDELAALESIGHDFNINVDADTTGATAKVKKLKEEAGEDPVITPEVDPKPAQAKVSLLKLALAKLSSTIKVDAAVGAARDKVLAFRAFTDSLSASIKVRALTAVAAADLAFLSRPRVASVYVNLVKNPFDKATAALGKSLGVFSALGSSIKGLVGNSKELDFAKNQFSNLANTIVSFGPTAQKALIGAGKYMATFAGRFSGANLVADYFNKIKNAFSELDQAAVTAGKLGVVLGSVAGGAINAASGMVTLGASLMSIINLAGIASVGIGTGFVVGIGTLIVALGDFNKKIPDVVNQFKTLKTTISDNFWAKAASPIRDMATTIFPSLQSGIAKTSEALGGWTASLANAVKQSLTAKVLEGMFQNLSKSIDVAANANKPLVDALTILGQVGSALLPRLAGWFVDVSKQFDAFIQKASKDGSLNKWVEDGITALKELGTLIGNVVGFFQNLNTAAKMAGSDGLGTLVSVFDTINKAIGSPEGLNNLANIMRGASKVAEGLGSAISSIIGGLGSASASIGVIFSTLGSTLKTIGDTIGKIFSNTEFQQGAVALFDGLNKGITGLAPAVADLAPKMGAVATVMGKILEVAGPVLGQAIELVIAPLISLHKAVEPIIPILGDALMNIMKSLKPLFDALGPILEKLGPPLGELAKALGEALVAAIDALMPIILPMIEILGDDLVAALKIATSIIKIVAALLKGDFSAAFAGLGDLFKNAATGVLQFVEHLTGIDMGPAIKFLEDNWDKMFQSLGDSWNNFWGGLQGMGNDIFGGINQAMTDFGNGWNGFWADVAKGWNDFWGGIQGMGGDIFSGISSAVQGFVDWWNGLWGGISEGWNSFWTEIGTSFMAAWQGIVDFFQPVTDLIVTIIVGVTQIVAEIWTQAWNIVSTVFIGVWNNIVAFFAPIIQSISDTITTVVTNVMTIWNDTWNNIFNFFTAIWNNIVAFFTPIITAISTTISSVLSGISATWNAIWGAISGFVQSVWNTIVSVVTGYINNVRATISAVLSGIAAVWNSIWGSLVNAVSGAWSAVSGAVSGLVSSISSGINNVVNFFTQLPGRIMSAVGNFGSLLYNAGRDVIQGLINGIQGMIGNVLGSIRDIGGQMMSSIKGVLGIRSPSREFMKIGNWVAIGLVDGVTGGRPKVVKSMMNLAQRMTDAATKHFNNAKMKSVIKAGQKNIEIAQGRQIDAAAAAVRSQINYLGSLAKQREVAVAKLKTAQNNLNKALQTRNKEAEGISNKLMGEVKLSNFVGMDAKDIVSGVKEIADRIKLFGTKMTQLKKLGLGANILAEIAGLGSADGIEVADALIAGGKSQVGALNAAYSQLGSAAKGTGLQIANGMYGAGIDAMQGLVNGFQKNVTAIDAAAKKVGDRLLAQVKKVLGIRSPSRVFRDVVGVQIGAGIAEGIRSSTGDVVKAAADLAEAAVPDASAVMKLTASSGPIVTTSSVTAATTTGSSSASPVANNGVTSRTDGGVNVNVYPSAGMDERLVGDIAVRELNFQLLSR